MNAHRVNLSEYLSVAFVRSFPEKLLLAFLGYESIEGLVRRFFSNQSQNILLGKDVALALLFLLVSCNQPRKFYSVIRKFDKPFLFTMYCFAAVTAVRMVGAPVSLYVQIESLSTYFLCIPIVFAGYLYAELSPDWTSFWRILQFTVFLVAAYAILQAVTGFDTAAQLAVDDDAGGAGGFYRNSGEGLILSLASTLYIGRLGTYGATWFFIAVMLLFLRLMRKEKLKFLQVALIVASLICLILGQNRTAILTTLAVGSPILYQFSRSVRFSRLSYLMLTGLATTVAGLVLFGWVLNSDSTAVQTSQLSDFLSQVTDSTEYDVEGINTMRAVIAIYERVGFWGAGTGTLAPAATRVVDENPLEGFGAEGTPLRLLFEFGVPGLVAYFAMFGRLLFILIRRSLRARIADPPAAFCLLCAAGALLVYLVVGYKHFGFAQDITFQSYVFTFVGSVMGGTAARRQVIGMRTVIGKREFVIA